MVAAAVRPPGSMAERVAGTPARAEPGPVRAGAQPPSSRPPSCLASCRRHRSRWTPARRRAAAAEAVAAAKAASQLTNDAEVSVTGQCFFYLVMIDLDCHLPGITIIGIKHVFQHLFILLDKATSRVITQNAKENILVVCEVR